MMMSNTNINIKDKNNKIIIIETVIFVQKILTFKDKTNIKLSTIKINTKMNIKMDKNNNKISKYNKKYNK
jgi:hypothetical protein